VLLSAFSLDLFAVLFGGAVAILPVFADEVLKAGAIQLGWLRAAPAIGSAGMAMMLAFRKPMKNAGKNLLWAVFGFGICMIGFGLSTHFWVAFFFLFFSGVLDSISVVIRNTITQLYTPDEMRGRVSAVSSMFIGSSNEIGAFESGLAAQSMGLVPSLLFGGSMTIMIVGMIAWKAPALRALSLRDPQQE
jgi:sugar phosphate permease